MEQASPLRRKPLSPEERAIVSEAHANGVPTSILAEQYECSPDTIRAIVRRAKKIQREHLASFFDLITS